MHLNLPTSAATTLRTICGEFATVPAAHSLRVWYVFSSTKVGFAWGLYKCLNKHWKWPDLLSDGPIVPTKAFSPKSSPEQPRNRLLIATSTVGIEDW